MGKIKDENCKCHHADDGELLAIKADLEGEKDINQLSRIYKGIGDLNRLKIIYVLSKAPLCVYHIADLLEMTQSSISHHLKVLRDLDLVKFEKQGKLVVYSLDDEHVLKLLEVGLEHIKHHQ